MLLDEARQIRVMTALVILGTFLAGAAVGAGVYRWLLPRPPPPPPMMGLPIHDLGLSAEQEAQAHAVMDRHRDELEAIMRSTYPQVRAVQEQMEKEVRALLTPEQQKRLDEALAHRRPRHPGPPPGEPGRGPPPGGPPPPR